ncbi:MAG: hypothetical protein K6E14_04420 [Paludibacteraceae bacterium]|nr:hypothetical protein [Paludibacteraceae bacterium]
MSNNTSANNKRIAKNTLALYFRTFITMIVGLYTSRVMLQALGVENYGINNVVGGIVSMSSLITGTTSQSISRFLTFAIGKGEKQSLKILFSTSITIQIVIAIIVALALEIFGIWFLNLEANIPCARMDAANLVLHFSIITLVINLISAPYNALIIAYERMNIFAYVSIIEVILKLSICFAIMVYGGDRLILFSFLQVIVALIMRVFYSYYSRKNFEEARYNLKLFDKAIFNEMAAFSGWNFFGNTAWVFNTQGVNMLVNVFFGVTFNAARGLAITVNNCVQSFVNNFTIAFSPQITKSFALQDYNYCFNLANKGTKFSWLLMYLFVVPVCIEAETILNLWLVEVPPLTVIFLRFAMFETLAVKSGGPLYTLIQATGDVKRYTIEVSLFGGTIFPLTWLFFRLGAPVWSTYLIFISIYFSLNIFRLNTLKRLIGFPPMSFVKSVIVPCSIVSVVSFVLPLIVSYYLDPGIIRLAINIPISLISTCSCIFIFGLTKEERAFLMQKAAACLNKFYNK